MVDRPIELVDLPSLGRLYKGLMPGGRIEIMPMGTREEALLTSRKGRADGHLVLNEIVRRCLKTQFPLEDLLVSDWFYLLLMVRNVSYGNQYTYKITCSECGFKFQKEISIPQDFTIRILDEDAAEPFFVDLPVSKKRVGLRLLRVKDEQDVERFTQNEYRHSQQAENPGYIYRIAKHIMTIDDLVVAPEAASAGVKANLTVTPVTLEKALEFVEGLLVKDSSVLKEELARKDCGVNLTLVVDCPSCGESFEDLAKLTTDFFRYIPHKV